MKKRTLLILILAALAILLSGCGDEAPETDKTASAVTSLSFKSASSYSYLKTLNGKKVTINGYLATSSPVDGSFIFLMNLPYQSCPFCKPNTSQLSNTMEVYPKEGERFSYTTQAVRVTGTLRVADNEGESFTDMYGYEFNFKIVDADYVIIKAEELSPEMAVWQKIAQSDVISEIYGMYDYVNFLCAWPTYWVNSYTDEDGNTVTGYYLYSSDAEHYLKEDGAQFNYGYQEGYFDRIVNTVLSCDAKAFESLIANIRKAQTLAEKALGELENGNYSYSLQYVEKFGNEDYIFTLNTGDELTAEFEKIYNEFADWLGTWEM